jgi:DNA-nicking Smr family endonuclease
MTSRRDTTPDERSLFHSAFQETRPLVKAKPKPDAKAQAKPARSSPEGKLDGSTAERLRRGQMDPEARIDLHGMTEAAAHAALLKFLRAAHKRGLRLALVVTGKGGREQSSSDLSGSYRSRGVLKSLVPRWLREPDFAELVVGTKTAHRRHGGEGALYVYVRKNRP